MGGPRPALRLHRRWKRTDLAEILQAQGQGCVASLEAHRDACRAEKGLAIGKVGARVPRRRLVPSHHPVADRRRLVAVSLGGIAGVQFAVERPQMHRLFVEPVVRRRCYLCQVPQLRRILINRVGLDTLGEIFPLLGGRRCLRPQIFLAHTIAATAELVSLYRTRNSVRTGVHTPYLRQIPRSQPPKHLFLWQNVPFACTNKCIVPLLLMTLSR